MSQPPSSNLYKPSLQQNDDRSKQNFDTNLTEIDLMSIDQCNNIQQLDDSHLVGPPNVTVINDAVATSREGTGGGMVKLEAGTGKRKRGRPPRSQVKITKHLPQSHRINPDEEDVCFICFDGGTLVLCDRRGCPKAYHPACIKRDEAFFRSKAKWNCGWHICTSCQKASHYMCYTCPYSLCKGCIKDADYFGIRGTKGFCGTCMKTILLIENSALGNNEMVQVDFDDKTSWEYLFKVYWVYLKEKLSLTLDELTRAKNPWKEPSITAPKGELYDGSTSENFCGDLEASHTKRRKTKQPEFLNKVNPPCMEKSCGDEGMPLPEDAKWATKELLDLVAHMKNGDISVLTHFDVQALLLEYIKRNNLRDPRRKSQIVCDQRLINLFGKTRVGHFEMLKLLESHFLFQENSPVQTITGGVVDVVASQVQADVNIDNQLMMENDKRRKTRKKVDKREAYAVYANPDEYAAIDVHNINLIYLKRSSMENLMGEVDNFHDKVVGSFVRIKISGSDQKQDMYRLVQVTGTSKAAEPYKIGDRTTDIMLEILNLRKKELVSIDGISNQEFSEDECRRLRQCIKCGLIECLTVGKIQEKASTLQALRVNDLLESEVLRLNNLRDRASEKGHRKELRECVEKLQFLNSADERNRRLLVVPEVHTDPNMDPNCESEEDAGEFDEKKPDNHVRSGNPSFVRKEREPFSPQKVGDILNDIGSRTQKNSATTLEHNTSMCTTFYVDRDGTVRVPERVNESPSNQGKESVGLANSQAGPTTSVTGDWNNNAAGRSESFSGVASGALPPTSTAGMEQPIIDFEIDKMWHYQDPTGKIQGPFSMVQLRKWSESGHFPPDLLVWRINQKQDDSILLIDALSGRYQKEPSSLYNNCLLPLEVRVASGDGGKTRDVEWSGSIDATHTEIKRDEGSLDTVQNDGSAHSGSNDETGKSSGCGSHSSSLTMPADVNCNEGQIGSSLPGLDILKDDSSLPDQPSTCNSLPTPIVSEKPCETLSHQVKESQGGEVLKSDHSSLNGGSHKSPEGQINVGHGYDKQVDSECKSGQSSGQNWRHNSSNGWDPNSGFAALAKALELSDQNQEIDFSDLPSPTPKPRESNLKEGQAVEMKQSVSSDALVQDSGPSWSTASSPVGGGPQLPDVAGEWGGYSPTPAKRSVEEWDCNLVPASSLKPTDVVSDCAGTPTSGGCQLTHCSPSLPASNLAGWQAIVGTEPEEFTPLADESVSDLLAEVEAMESLNALASPTSTLRCGVELTLGSVNDCFSPVDGLSPTHGPGKSDALSSSNDLQMHSQSTVTDEPLGVSQACIFFPQKNSGGRSSTGAEAEEETKRSDNSVNQCDVGLDIRHEPPVASWDMAATDTWRLGLETTNISRGTAQGNANLGAGLAQGITNVGWGTGQLTAPENGGSMNLNTCAGIPGILGSQPRYGGDRFSGPRDHRDFNSRDSNFGRGRPVWNRQVIYGVGNGGGSFRPPPKGQRVCKFYENGYCKKGASCSYWHP